MRVVVASIGDAENDIRDLVSTLVAILGEPHNHLDRGAHDAGLFVAGLIVGHETAPDLALRERSLVSVSPATWRCGRRYVDNRTQGLLVE